MKKMQYETNEMHNYKPLPCTKITLNVDCKALLLRDSLTMTARKNQRKYKKHIYRQGRMYKCVFERCCC